MAKYPYEILTGRAPTYENTYAEPKFDVGNLGASSGDDFQEDDFIEESNSQGLLDKVAGAMNEFNKTSLNVGANLSGVGPIYDVMRRNPIAGMTEMGAKIAGAKQPLELPELPQPESGLGKTVATVAGLAPIGYGLVKGGIGATKGLKSMFGLKSAMKGLSSKIGETVPFAEQAIAQEGRLASGGFQKTIQDIANTGIRDSDIDSWIDDIINELDPGRTTLADPGSIASKIASLKSNVIKSGGILNEIPKSLSGAQLQSKIATLKNALGEISSKAQGAFTPIMEKGLSKTNAGKFFRTSQKTYESSMKARDVVSQMTKRTILNRIAKGDLSEAELLALKTEAQRFPGLSQLLDDVIKSGAKIRKVKSARGLAKGAGYTAGGIAGLNFLKSLMGGNTIQNITTVLGE